MQQLPPASSAIGYKRVQRAGRWPVLRRIFRPTLIAPRFSRKPSGFKFRPLWYLACFWLSEQPVRFIRMAAVGEFSPVKQSLAASSPHSATRRSFLRSLGLWVQQVTLKASAQHMTWLSVAFWAHSWPSRIEGQKRRLPTFEGRAFPKSESTRCAALQAVFS